MTGVATASPTSSMSGLRPPETKIPLAVLGVQPMKQNEGDPEKLEKLQRWRHALSLLALSQSYTKALLEHEHAVWGLGSPLKYPN